jgi:hypothetical protein
MPTSTLERIRRAIHDQTYRISSHANEEMSEDSMTSDDIECIMRNGRISRKLTRDPRGVRYVVSGNTIDGRSGAVVCRFLDADLLLIITAYVVE